MATTWQAALGPHRLVVSGFGTFGGGVYDLTTGVAEALDDLSTAGLALGGDRLWRLLRAPGEHTGTCELLSYDDIGVRSYARIDGVRDPHDLCFFDGAVHVTSSWDNAVWRITAKGKTQRVWQGTTVPDSWHPNSLLEHRGSLHVCAFGRFERHKGWRADAHRGAGFVIDLASGHDVLSGLDAPHDPRPTSEGGWLVCESSTGLLSKLGPDGARQRSIEVGHYARGLAVVEGFAFVGVSAHRGLDERTAELVVVDLARGTVAHRMALPCLEVYTVLTAPAPLVAGLRRGFATNAARVAEQVQREGWPAERQPTPVGREVALAAPVEASALAEAGAPHAVEQLNGVVEAEVTGRAAADAQLVVTVTVRNLSAFPFATLPPNKIGVAARWYAIGADGEEGPAIVGPLSPLPQRLDPGDTGEVPVVIDVPAEAGRYRLSLALQQVGVAWFGVRHDTTVEVSAANTVAG